MRVLVACEFSGRVRDEFARRGHFAVSCDLLHSASRGYHYRGNVLDILNDDWDLMIAHPPCTFLASSGARWLRYRKQHTELALDFILQLMGAPIPRICIENPVGLISTRIRPPDQIIEPWWFGHAESKRTCLWLKGLPLLKPTKIMDHKDENTTPGGHNKVGNQERRSEIRSMTYVGVARAMAKQWGKINELRSVAQVVVPSGISLVELQQG